MWPPSNSVTIAKSVLWFRSTRLTTRATRRCGFRATRAARPCGSALFPRLAVISNEVIDDRLGVIRRDGRAEGIDHLVHLGRPNLRRHEWCVRADVVEAVACAATSPDGIPAGSILDRDRWF